MSEAASREIQRSHIVISIQGEVSVQKTSGCIIICHGQNIAAFHRDSRASRGTFKETEDGDQRPNMYSF